MKREILVAIGVTLCSLPLLAAEFLTNDTGGTATALRVEFSEPVRITGYGDILLDVMPDGEATEFTFSGGAVESWGMHWLNWEPSQAVILSYEWKQSHELGIAASSGDGVLQGSGTAASAGEGVLLFTDSQNRFANWDTKPLGPMSNEGMIIGAWNVLVIANVPALVCRTAKCETTQRRGLYLADHTLEFDMRLACGSISIKLRQNPLGCYELVLSNEQHRPGVDRSTLELLKCGQTDADITKLASVDIAIDAETLFRLRIELDRNRISIYMDDKLVWSGEDTEDPHLAGEMNLTACRSRWRCSYDWVVSIREFKVWSLHPLDMTAYDGWSAVIDQATSIEDIPLVIFGDTAVVEEDGQRFLEARGLTSIELARGLRSFLLDMEIRFGDATLVAYFRENQGDGLEIAASSFHNYIAASRMRGGNGRIAASPLPAVEDQWHRLTVVVTEEGVAQAYLDGGLLLGCDVGQAEDMYGLRLRINNDGGDPSKTLAIRSLSLRSPDAALAVFQEELDISGRGELRISDSQERFANWDIAQGGWEVVEVDGAPALAVHADSQCWGTVRHSLRIEDCFLQFDLRLASGGVAIRLRQGPRGRYVLSLSRGGLTFAKHNSNDSDRTTFAEKPILLDGETWYKLQVELHGNLFSVYIDGILVCTVEDAGDPHLAGKLSLEACSGTRLWIREFQVWSSEPLDLATREYESVPLQSPEDATAVLRVMLDPDSTGELLVQDSQEQFANWRTDGRWHTDGRCWGVTDVDGAPVLAAAVATECFTTWRDALHLTDCLLQFDLRISIGGLLIRLPQKALGPYEVAFSLRSGSVELARFGATESDRAVLAEKHIALDGETWYKLQIELRHGQIAVYINDVLVLLGEDPGQPHLAGEISLEAERATRLWIREFQVWSLEPL